MGRKRTARSTIELPKRMAGCRGPNGEEDNRQQTKNELSERYKKELAGGPGSVGDVSARL
jgi:hypothetical protein